MGFCNEKSSVTNIITIKQYILNNSFYIGKHTDAIYTELEGVHSIIHLIHKFTKIGFLDLIFIYYHG